MSVENNKEVVKQFYEAINTKNWELLKTLLHDEYHSGDVGAYIVEVTKTKTNPFIEFFKLLGWDNEVIKEAENKNIMHVTKQSQIEFEKWKSQYQNNYEIQRIIAEKNEVWVYINSTFHTVNQRTFNHTGYEHFTLKETKLIQSFGSGRFLASLIQMGKVIIAEKDEEEINNYLQGLRKMGILPEIIKNAN